MTNFVKQISLCFLLALFFTGCQDRKGTAAILKEAEALMYTRPDSALQMLETISQPEQLMGQEQADYALLLTQARSRNRITATSDSLIRIASDYYQDSNDKARKAKAFLYLGDVYMDMQNHIEAMKALKQAEEQVNDAESSVQSLIYSNLAYLNRESGNYELAKKYYLKVLDINKINGYTEWVISNLTNILALPLPEVQDSLTNYITQLEEVLLSAHFDLQAKAYNNIGVHYYKKNLLEQAANYFRKAIHASVSVPYRAYLNLARIYDEEGKTARADSLYQVALQSPIWATRARIYEALYNRSLHAHRYQEATEYMKCYRLAADSFYTQRQSQKIQELQTKYDFEVLAREKAETENSFYRLMFGSFCLFFMLSTIGFWIHIHHKRQHQNYLQQLKDKISKIEWLKEQNENMEEEIRNLNHILQQGGALRDEVMQAKGEWTSLDDICALGLYIRLRQDLKSYQPLSDYDALLHWVNITSDNFTRRLTQSYPHLSTTEITLCSLKRMKYSTSQLAEILHVKIASVNRYIYRCCTSLELPNSKESFDDFIESF